MNALATSYLGLEIGSPVVVSSSPLTMRLDNLRAMEDAGAGAVVLGSLFEEQIRHDAAALYTDPDAVDPNPVRAYLPAPEDYALGPHEYLEFVRSAKEAVGIPVVASLNSSTIGAWVQYADLIQQAGADALELNLFLLPTDPAWSGSRVEQDYMDIVQAVRLATDLPLAVKLGPFFSSFPAMAKALGDAGCDALVLFNRFYQPDVDLGEGTVVPRIAPSQAAELSLSLRWIGMLYGRIELELAGSSGVHHADDALKLVGVGATVTMVCSALLRRGIGHVTVVNDGIRHWLDRHDVESVERFRGSFSQLRIDDPGAFERANYVEALNRYR